MSIKSIDTQIMVARTADMAKDTSAIQKKPEIAQEYLAVREKINDEQDQSRIAKTLDTRLSELRPDEEGGGNGGYDGQGSDPDGRKRKDDADLLVPADDHIIDIKV
ncbi:MAG: hypothetical protein FWH33_09060 [Oscillospiraceae bacterium]|nr:hypothetical protein [Oscillospiraceae bacterium]MCL2126118.1 hypothetical protein [Oscillospiraceae bacterium]